jgi:hypothetical protein
MKDGRFSMTKSLVILLSARSNTSANSHAQLLAAMEEPVLVG